MPSLSKNLFSLKFGFRFLNSKYKYFMEIIEGHKALKLTFLMTIDGTDDELIRPQGLDGYEF